MADQSRRLPGESGGAEGMLGDRFAACAPLLDMTKAAFAQGLSAAAAYAAKLGVDQELGRQIGEAALLAFGAAVTQPAETDAGLKPLPPRAFDGDL